MSEFVRKTIPSGSGPVALIILDGFGLRSEVTGNAVALAKKPNFDALHNTYPHTTLQASGPAVGLPEGQFGNSEVGHSNIGAGRILYQDLTRIALDIQNGTLFENPVLKRAMNHATRHKSTLHLLGLVSDGGVHSHIDHLQALLRMTALLDVPRVAVHVFLDGRDTPPTTGLGFLKRIEEAAAIAGNTVVATVQGRYFAMDRDKRWDRTGRAYQAIVHGEGTAVEDLKSAVQAQYDAGVTDEFMPQLVHVNASSEPLATVRDEDSVIFFNFRPDRAIQLSAALTDKQFDGFDRGSSPPFPLFVSLTKYSDAIASEIAYPPRELHQTFGEVVSAAGLTQLRIAETEKYPHVTFFFSGGQETPFPGEERVLVPSPKVATYDLQPEMSAYEVAKRAADRIDSGDIDVMILNFANPDMVGHTGDLQAAIRAIEAVDECLQTVLDAIFRRGGVALVTADHGNADIMIDPQTGGPCTTHTTNPVPLIVTRHGLVLEHGVLADLAPTMLSLLGIAQPSEMEGKSLIVEQTAR
ncbi:2,3-bisphosphoglycerate-independent phosphoglycerate mutase [Alicyclobacillus sp. SP_1]|uniref:2,3-bisphosphoglycerate-independent phosphoglycerate mutase n=1 Tax=Alicyclobacillus sp. SP_1 TaxID=2942475 RepID=UPI00215814F2|nr:2,3-bisphosphoglycerate-independent phosphoglycerate mutase [Alicyclobacillus sp. SP_1]